MADVFISYKKENRSDAERVAKALESSGFSVWWDDRIRPQGEWDAQIEKEINDAKATVVLWTPLSVASRWVRAEAHNANDRGRMIPAMVETCDIPIAFSLSQTANLVGWNGDPEHRQWRKLLAWVEDLVHTDAADGAPHDASGQPHGARRGVIGKTRSGDDVLDGVTITSHTPAGTAFQDGETLPIMRIVPKGSFIMGASRNDPDARPSEFPPRLVVFSRPFAIGVYPVTLMEWSQFFPPDSALDRPGEHDGALPATNLSWDDAMNFVEALSRKTGETYRLPSEAEWEYACRAGINGPFGLLDPLGPTIANYDDTVSFKGSDTGEGGTATTIVGAYPANRYGLHDMHGNVREWVEDSWHDNYLELPDGGLAWTQGYSPMRVVRGGGWLDDPIMLRSSARGRATRGDRSNFIGFRVVRELV